MIIPCCCEHAPTGAVLVLGHIDVCLCLSVILDFVASDPTCQKGAQHVGNDGVASILQNHVSPTPLPSMPADPH